MTSVFSNITNLFREDLDNSNSSYYMVLSRFTPWTDESNVPARSDSLRQGDFNFRKEMFAGKKISSSDGAFLINNISWTTGTIYDQYDDSVDITGLNYYVINSNDDIFKCISNSANTTSTEEPVSKTADIFEMADGYKWKYMYTLSSANNTKFGSSSYIPVDANTTISEAAIPGTIDNIVVTSGGTKFDRYAVGQIQNSANGNLFQLSSNNSGLNNYYNNLMIYISNGLSDGNTARITQHFSNTTGIYIVTGNTLTLDYTSQYIIYPEIVISGDGDGARAYCTVNTVSKSIDRVYVINPGSAYTTANVYANTGNTTDETLRPVISPINGHGYDPITELGSEKFMVITTFDGNAGGEIPSELPFRKYGLIKNISSANGDLYTAPYFDNTIEFSINVASSNTSFVIGEKFQGETSGAIGILAFANSSVVIGTNYKGEFQEDETIITYSSLVTATISNINSPTINSYSGDILFYDVSSAIDRSNSSLEDVGFIISNVSGI